jgi:hypothetical protein
LLSNFGDEVAKTPVFCRPSQQNDMATSQLISILAEQLVSSFLIKSLRVKINGLLARSLGVTYSFPESSEFSDTRMPHSSFNGLRIN